VRLGRGPDDADVIRARLRALLAEGGGSGWVPADDADPAPVPAAEEHRGDDLPAALGRHRAPGAAVRLDPGRPGARALWIAAVLAVLVLLALTWRDRPTPIPVPAPASSSADGPVEAAGTSSGRAAEPTAAPAELVVSVVGRVVRPGLVTLAEGARVADAVEAAGGFLPGADPSTVNLAAPLADGQQVAVGVPGAAAPAGSGPGASTAGGPVDVNRAGVAELEALPGVGPVLAQRIVEHREQHGPFAAVDELQDVPGIGPAIFDGLADAVTV
jgi:competence protein ComEA